MKQINLLRVYMKSEHNHLGQMGVQVDERMRTTGAKGALSWELVLNLFGLWPIKTLGCLFATTQHSQA